ncbi:5-dehydro-4-deoxyglucarate dehydratase [Brachybacterium saurashtrense]|uniref:Probable 5-dehydro-4-deoxyglucarate dehydratase n=1 Tax=Brachybacterium saurashtrense TaxID=556288 RepID=A0A345YMS3_9MICO|nr:5-dehydro-4-deoxyglucarate dehydratase [Brachybacterium saurashtrense]AXK45225.1 5-dehydro-4-deoxyglucarate dehydratase [Brachybacterium saurashtrense]RRR22021.1 5-dehydro-4-deoxyglucarate dehydratase [Brachybacterium saurashtrense]
MALRTPQELAAELAGGLLSFPATAFDAELALDETAYRRHLDWQASHPIGGLFAAGGTGEGFSLLPEESARVIRIAVEEAGDRVPVLGAAGGSTLQAVRGARDAEAAGAEGLLLLPPYLTECDQEGLAAHVSAVCEATSLGVIVYHRATAVYEAGTLADLAARHENLIGFKDGVGDLAQLTRIRTLLGERLLYLGGLPTAEAYALPLLQLGMSTYSSALYNVVPEFALAFYADVRRGDHAAVTEKLARFVLPYLEIRDRAKGYGVSIVKGGLRAVGRDLGPVRPPLQDLTAQDVEDLRILIDAAGIHPGAAAASAA